jgi:uncharacterized protein (TIGR00661 family)
LNTSKNILVAPLNWGLGHASRCVPIVEKLIECGYTPILASDGQALEFLKKEFPNLITIELPSYNIQYARQGFLLKWKLLFSSFSVRKAVREEHKKVAQIIQQYQIQGVISDNRLGVYSDVIPSVYITHQIQVLSGFFTPITSFVHQKFIRNFDECWIPDDPKWNLAGELSNLKNVGLKIKHIGVLSRFRKQNVEIEFDLAVILSGPEPQRTLLEEKILTELPKFDGKAVFIKGKMEMQQTQEVKENITFYNYLVGKDLEGVLNKSRMILSRSGYSTVMDLFALRKKAFFIPTPGQTEQEYLAQRMGKLKIAPYCLQKGFTIDKLNEIQDYKGFESSLSQTDWEDVFRIFD